MAFSSRFSLPFILSPSLPCKRLKIKSFHFIVLFSLSHLGISSSSCCACRSLSSLPAAFSVSKLLRPLSLFENRRNNLLRVRCMSTGDSPSVPRSVAVRVAHELLQAGHRYLDVRTIDEFNAGHPVGATNIPYMLKVGSGMKKNPKFLAEVSSVFSKDDEIIVGCQSGRRSLMAAADLSSAGFTGITDVSGGYSAWEQNGLPTE